MADQSQYGYSPQSIDSHEIVEEASSSTQYSTPVRERQWFRKKRFVLPLASTLAFVGCMELATRSGPGRGRGWEQSVSSSGLDTATRSMPFEQCKDQIDSAADDLDISPVTIVDTSAMRTVRLPLSDGSILMTCDAIDETLIMVKSPSRDG